MRMDKNYAETLGEEAEGIAKLLESTRDNQESKPEVKRLLARAARELRDYKALLLYLAEEEQNRKLTEGK